MADVAAILRIAEEVRREQCPSRSESGPCSVGMCQFVTRMLEERLTAAGLAPRLIGGYYTAEAMHDPGTRSPLPIMTTTWDGVWMHWWLECDGLVIDAMADRFAANSARAPEVVVLPKAAARDYHARLPAGESAQAMATSFEQ